MRSTLSASSRLPAVARASATFLLPALVVAALTMWQAHAVDAWFRVAYDIEDFPSPTLSELAGWWTWNAMVLSVLLTVLARVARSRGRGRWAVPSGVGTAAVLAWSALSWVLAKATAMPDDFPATMLHWFGYAAPWDDVGLGAHGQLDPALVLAGPGVVVLAMWLGPLAVRALGVPEPTSAGSEPRPVAAPSEHTGFIPVSQDEAAVAALAAELCALRSVVTRGALLLGVCAVVFLAVDGRRLLTSPDPLWWYGLQDERLWLTLLAIGAAWYAHDSGAANLLVIAGALALTAIVTWTGWFWYGDRVAVPATGLAVVMVIWAVRSDRGRQSTTRHVSSTRPPAVPAHERAAW